MAQWARQMKLRSRLPVAQKAELMVAYHRSGLTRKDFAALHGIAESTFQRWVAKSPLANKPNGQAVLVEVPNLLATDRGHRQYRLHFPKGLILEIGSGFEPGELRVLAQVVQSL
jgi:transposase-like protein